MSEYCSKCNMLYINGLSLQTNGKFFSNFEIIFELGIMYGYSITNILVNFLFLT